MFGFFYSVLWPIKWFSGGGSIPNAKTTTTGEYKTTTSGDIKTITN